MRYISKYSITIFFIFIITILYVQSCVINSSNDEDNKNIPNREIIIPNSFSTNSGRLLGSQCAQCHGTNGFSITDWDSIAGEDDLMGEFYDNHPLMTAQAKGYTKAEINDIAQWLKTVGKEDNNDDNDDD